jgi:hypothetical protein
MWKRINYLDIRRSRSSSGASEVQAPASYCRLGEPLLNFLNMKEIKDEL